MYQIHKLSLRRYLFVITWARMDLRYNAGHGRFGSDAANALWVTASEGN